MTDAETPKRLARAAIPKAIIVICLGLAILLAGVLAATRYGVLLPQARLLIEARTDGLRVGRLGKLKLEGLSGDVWRDFTVRKLTIRDEAGVWLQADNVRLHWRYADLLRRRFHADSIVAARIRVLRRPTLTAKTKDRGLPVSFEVVKATGRLEMEPAFSYRRGVYDLKLALDVERAGRRAGRIEAASLLHPGDRLDVAFDFSKTRPIRLVAEGREAQGGALAGALGLPADQPFVLDIKADGVTSRGQFSAVATSGGARPLDARGAWTPDGGQASGRISLTASRLTAAYARRLGPEATFNLTGRRAPSSLYDLNGRIASQNVTLTARGLGNLGERRLGPRGLNLEASTPDLARILGRPSAGAARLGGVLAGDLTAWRFAGAAAIADATVGAYGLNRISGPVEVASRRGDVEVTARLAGSGGRGEGWIAAMLGGAPQGAVTAARLRDGRLLLRRLSLTGAGLKVEASGGRSLLGGLNFKGSAQASNLARARPGAAGGASATWSAIQAGAGRPWTVTVDARGERLATGYAELDRLLGASPRLRGQANLDGQRIAISEATLDGAAMKVTAAGVRGGDGALQFKLDWSATGPFRAGPAEITGRAKGAGVLTGTLSAPRADLTADLESLDIPRLPLRNARLTISFLRTNGVASGLAGLNAESAYGPARAKAAFRFAPGGIDLSDLDVDAGGVRASGALALRNRSPSSADLKVAVTPGAFVEAGRIAGEVRIVDAAGGAQARVRLSADDARIIGTPMFIQSGRLTADGPLARLPYVLDAQGQSGQGGWRLQGRGLLTPQTPGYQLTLDGSGKMGARELKTTETATFTFGGPVRTARLRMAGAEGGRIDLDGRFASQDAEVRAELAGLGLGLLDPDLAGEADGVLTLRGRGERLDGTLDARLENARGKGSPANAGVDGAVRIRLADNVMNVEANLSNEAGLASRASLVLPTESSAAPFRIAIARLRPMSGSFSAAGEVRPLFDLLIGGERTLSGQVRTEGRLGGSLANPKISGSLAVDAGRFNDGVTGLTLRDVVLKASFGQSAVSISEARGTDGQGGSVTGSGVIGLARDSASSFKLDLRQFRLIDNEQATASASGQASIARGADGKVRLSGVLDIDRADVAARLPTPSGVVPMDVVERNRPPALQASLPPLAKRGDGWALDVTLRAPRRVFLRGRGLDVELSLDAHVGGTTSATNLSGTARVVRGDYDFAGKRFEFDTQSVVYLATRPQNIRLELAATRDDPSLTAVIRIRGTAAKPEVTFTSSPSLPNDEVLSQVLFGRSASQLSPLEAAQLASALSALATGGGFDVVGNLRTFARLDRLAFAGGDQNGVTVSGGKYITDDVYLELTGGGRDGPSAQVEWRIRKTLAIVSRLGGQGEGRLAIRWRKDY